MNALTARRFLISGRVQGVGYRYFAQKEACEIGVTGWASNLPDGRVEVHANGTKKQVDEFEARLREGPRSADVGEFEISEAAVSNTSEFDIR